MSDSDKKVTEGELIPALGNIVKQKITRPKELFLLFWVDEFDPAKALFEASAKTRLNNIKNSFWYQKEIHIVEAFPIETFDEIGMIITKYINLYGGTKKVKVQEVGIFSHSARLGPIMYDNLINSYPVNPSETRYTQMSLDGWNNICSNWKKNAMCVFYGCNSANENMINGEIITFAENVSKLPNFKDVTVIGQSSSSYPSFFPDYRISNLARSTPFLPFAWNIGTTYMVAGRLGEGIDVLFSSYSGLLNYQLNEIEKSIIKLKGVIGISNDTSSPIPNNTDYITVEPMNFYKNGIKISSTHQGVFNDHRKNKK